MSKDIPKKACEDYWLAPIMPQTMQVIEEEDGAPTGLLDSNGRPIVRRKNRVGFDLRRAK